MRKLLFLFCTLFVVTACEKKSDFQKVDIFDMRVNNIESVFSYSDFVIKISDFDTVGQTKLFLNENLVYSHNWEIGYQSSVHVKTNIRISKKNNLELVVIGHSLGQSEIFIVQDGVLKEQLELIFSPLQIKVVEVDEFSQKIKIIGNKTWIRTPKYEDEEVFIFY